ncbi:archease [Ferroplasma acidiphilum]|jgi:SHS2 domain-containing protein|uniref:Archease domain-containing protein n=3 Tax=Ferroplasma acidiphilum TaxID=74969 RepID=A0A1V0N252_9ARCH|nr:archease [Ferroplasma acidiphilum]ARD84230.1 hypothetical protein FAD_0308 [Ferroplasma acidiphilum]MCL4349348.1 archease [Candidatus Thermoplasmatota archaeon]WMT53137.1 MAG: archease [Ferroplasma acidiphilum]
MKYDILDHTADLKIKVYGNSLNSIFENSVAAISDLITGSSSMENTIKRKVEITKQSVDDMLIQLLNDVIFYLETENVLFQRAEINISGNRLNGILSGTKLPDNLCYSNAIKAVTYYNLEISPEEGFAILVLDV